MKVAILLLVALASARPSARAQVEETPSAPPGNSVERQASPPVFDARAYWTRFDAEPSARQAQLDRVDVRTPRIVTLSLLAPAAILLLTGGVTAIVESSSVTPFDLLPHGERRDDGDEERRHVNPRNYWLTGAGGVLALAAIGTGIWWRLRSVERSRIEARVGLASNEARLRGLTFAVQAGAEGLGLVLRGGL